MIIDADNYKNHAPGSKAWNLFRLLENGYPVPPFFCVDEAFEEEEVIRRLNRCFSGSKLFSVRSSASVEDGAEYSFAGQFCTFLRVREEEVCACIRKVFSQAEESRVSAYGGSCGMASGKTGMHVIVQEMVEAELSGVLFTVNPQGLLNETVIVLGAGTGEQVVEERTDTTTYYYNRSDAVYYFEQTGEAPLLDERQVEELICISGQVRDLFGMECDMEYALQNGKLWLLQTRPITGLDKEASVIILDNSNIVESYPGITLPLTQSFIREAYYQVFKNLLNRLTGESETVQKIDEVLKHMVDMANGRVYYRISSWYDVLLFLPFSKKLIPIWQEMMGVEEKAVSSSLQGKIRPGVRLKVTVSFFRLLLTCPEEMRRLDEYFKEIIGRFEMLDTATEDNRVLLEHYHLLQEMTVKRWDMTLVNDMYAFLFTGLLKARLKAGHVPDYGLEAKRAISGLHNLESLGPVQELRRLAEQAVKEKRLEELRRIRTREDYDRYAENTGDDFTRRIKAYICRYGDRNTEELKLESRTFRTDPQLLVRYILSYADSVLDSEKNAGSSGPDSQRKKDEGYLDRLSLFLAGRAALGIRNREKSRLNRSRLYGMMRTLVRQMGRNLHRRGQIEHPDDIFWLECGEIEQEASGTLRDLKELIRKRKELYEGFRALPAWSRLVFSGKVTDKHSRGVQNREYDSGQRVFRGTACSQGIAEGRVKIVREPSLEVDTKGRILVARMTDPGWVFLIAGARGLISEKGSLLSHTAIISRELGNPAVVGIPHITEYLKDGDLVRIDGDSGTVTVLQ